MVSIKDICWLAGILEGEGSFYTYLKVNKKSITSYPELSIQSVDFDVIWKISKLIGNNISRVTPYNSSKQNSYKVRACSTKAAQWMMTLYPLMGKRRRAKIREVLLKWKLSTDGRRRRS